MKTVITSGWELAGLKATWMSGDFEKLTRIIAAGGAEFVTRLPALRACGDGEPRPSALPCPASIYRKNPKL